MRIPSGRKDEVVELLREIAERPALNGGFEKLSQMQEEQCKDLALMKSDVSLLKDDVSHLKNLETYARKALWAIFLAAGGTLLKMAFELIETHVSIH